MNTITAVLSLQSGLLHSVSRRQAFLVHLSLSALIVGSVCATIFLVWYPEPYFAAKGAWSVLRILVGVDLVLGPALTLILFRPGKPGLLFDLMVIAVIQLSALIYGTTVIYQERPYFNVFTVDRFEVLPRNAVDPALIDPEKFGEKPFAGPLLVVAVLPEDQQDMQRLLEEVLFEGKPDLERRPEFWEPYSQRSGDVLARGKPLEELAAARPEARDEIDALLRRTPGLTYVPLTGRDTDFAFVIDPVTEAPIDIINVDPWLVETPIPE